MNYMNKLRINLKRRKFLLLALLLLGGAASAQVNIEGSVFGGGNLGKVLNASVTSGGTTTLVIDSTTVIINNGTIEGFVYGAGKGDILVETNGLVEGNAKVVMKGGFVGESIYGGGELGSVGTFTEFETVIDSIIVYDTADDGTLSNPRWMRLNLSVPTACSEGTGVAKVLLSGGQVGPNESLMPATLDSEDDVYGYVFAGGQGISDPRVNFGKAHALAVVDSTYLEISGTALITASAYGGSENGLVLRNTCVKMMGGQIGTGHWVDNQGRHRWDGRYEETAWNTAIAKIKDGTFTNADAAGFHECDHWPYGRFDTDANTYVFNVYDNYYGDSVLYPGNTTYTKYLPAETDTIGSNGHSFFGNLFGGGSGFYSYAPGMWRRRAGQVNGDTYVEISGGHILTDVYGGNEVTDVIGNATVIMTGGTIGVPRTLESIDKHPVTCYLFGGGMGDARVWANTWTNVENSKVEVVGGHIFGSVFGGGEDGHVLTNVQLAVKDSLVGGVQKKPWIGTWGYSYVDGNIFGGGRGFSGTALTAGSVGGNIDIDIRNANVLGSVYGGGRLASVGCGFHNVDEPEYGMMQEDGDGKTYGHVTINIMNSIIGNDYESKFHHSDHTKGGNVFGGSMGRLTQLNDSVNGWWPRLAKVKTSSITIEGDTTVIKGSVFGGSEFGSVVDSTLVTIKNGTIWRNVYGGGLGSDSTNMLADYIFPKREDPDDLDTIQVSPLQRAGRVEGNTYISIEGGWIKKCVYGGGKLGSVGTIYNDSIKHPDETQNFALSWPYEFNYKNNTGRATVNVTGGRIGITGKDYMGPWNKQGQPIYYKNGQEKVYNLSDADDVKKLKKAREDNGDVFGAARGVVGDRYLMAHSANVNNTVVTVQYPDNTQTNPENYKPASNPNPDLDYVYDFYKTYNDWTTYGTVPCIPGALYGGGENGHVIDSTQVIFKNGLVGHNIYGGGKGSDKYETTLYTEVVLNPDDPNDTIAYPKPYKAKVTEITAGKVYGNTYVTIDSGFVVRNVFGGGNRASVGKGNYSGGPGDYQQVGYGERWTSGNANTLRPLLHRSGNTYVTINGGQIGTANGDKDGLPTGNVFGSSRGEPAPNVRQTLSPRILYYPEFFLGYINNSYIKIGDKNLDKAPRLYGSVYGGGQDGHVRVGTNVVINKGEIGNAYVSPDSARRLVDTADMNHFQWLARGNVYGAGSGTTQYETYKVVDTLYSEIAGTSPVQYDTTYVYDTILHYSTSAGSVTQYTNVTINGGIIHRNVYGGGSLASVGPPRMALKYDANRSQSLAKVTVKAPIGVESDVHGVYTVGTGSNQETKSFTYGGHVFGGSRGFVDPAIKDLTLDNYATTIYTEVNLDSVKAVVPGNVYGGGELGQVKQCTEVNMNAGRVGTIAYVQKQIRPNPDPNPMLLDSVVHLRPGGRLFGGGEGVDTIRIAALVMDSTVVNMRGGHVLWNVYGGGELASVGLRDSLKVNNVFKDLRPQPDIHGADSTGIAVVNILGGQVGPGPKFEPKRGSTVYDSINVPIGLDGTDGYVFAGGRGYGNDTTTLQLPNGRFADYGNVNSTILTVNMPMPTSPDDTTNRIWGSIFGGAEDGHVLGNCRINYVNGLMGTTGTTTYDGNIFGGGRNYLKKNYTAGRVRGNDSTYVYGGHMLGSIFGGGRLALTGVDYFGEIMEDEQGATGRKYGNTFVKITGGKVGNADTIRDWTASTIGDVFGGGKGDMEGIQTSTHPAASALLVALTKNTKIIIQDSINQDGSVHSSPIIYGSVFGGGEVANVGHYLWKKKVEVEVDSTPYFQNPENSPIVTVNVSIDTISLKEGTGITEVIVNGGRIGVDNMEMNCELADGAHNYNFKYHTDLGHVFGGGEGIVDDPAKYDTVDPTFNNKPLIDLMATVGDTRVTVGGNAWVKGSVYGGSMNGHVLRDTYVRIAGGQIGAGYYPASTTQPVAKDSLYYRDGQFFDPITYFAPQMPGNNYIAPRDVRSSDKLAECYSWEYDPATNRPLDWIAIKDSLNHNHTIPWPTDGKTWFGNVFGGGSGYYPYFKPVAEGSSRDTAIWNPRSGQVEGNTTVEITGGHILTSVYGGSEIADVGLYFKDIDGNDSLVDGIATIIMRVDTTATGEYTIPTLGVPRDSAQIARHPVTCYLFGAGKGDPRTIFNTKTKVVRANVDIMGGIVYGSIFGGGEDGHVVGNAYVKVRDSIAGDTVFSRPIIGTTGRSYVDGNVFGGGRGFSSIALTAGVVAGDIDVNISGGTMLGSVYGGGRLASVGTYLVEESDVQRYGKLQPDNSDESHGHITVAIGGDAVIGNDYEAIYHTTYDTISTGGNVFVGSMGRLMKPDGVHVDTLWPRQALVKSTELFVRDSAVIKGSVYGGGEFGTVAENARISIEGGTIYRDVYGAGFGSERNSDAVKAPYIFESPITHTDSTIKVTPMQLAGRVHGNTTINISGGWVKKCVYGGGELASVGFVTDSIRHDTTKITHPEKYHPFALSWPYEFKYGKVNNKDTGIDSINITGGRIGLTGEDFMGPWAYDAQRKLKPGYTDRNGNAHWLTGDDLEEACVDNGDVFGGGKGIPEKPYVEAHCANTNNTVINIKYDQGFGASNEIEHFYMPIVEFLSDYIPELKDWEDYGERLCIAGAVYGGGENGHVNDNTKITFTKGLIGHGIYGGGKGKDKYKDANNKKVYSLTAGKVYGNTNITMNAIQKDSAYLVRSIFGGGNAASVGKGNYLKYGESTDNQTYLNTAAASGHCTINITGGTLGMLPIERDDNNKLVPNSVMKDDVPYGSVFGGCRGVVKSSEVDSIQNVNSIEARLSFVNNTVVTIGKLKSGTNNTNPATEDTLIIYGSVYGGGQDGKVRWNTDVTVNSGEIGVEYKNPTYANNTVGTDDLNTLYWQSRGNVFGGGSGLSQYEISLPNAENPAISDKVERFSIDAGVVMGKADVEIKGGLIHNNVFGGGVLATVGDGVGHTEAGHVTVRVNGNAEIGVWTDVNLPGNGVDTIFTYGGCVFGGGRGLETDSVRTYPAHPYSVKNYCNVDSTAVIISGGHVYGEVYGGAASGHVWDSTYVTVQDSAYIGYKGNTGSDGNVYGGGKGSGYYTIEDAGTAEADTLSFDIYQTAGRVGGNTHVTVKSGTIRGSIYGGGSLALTGVDVNAEFIDKDHGNTYIIVDTVQGKHTQIGTTNVHDILYTFYSVGDIFGSGKGDIENYMDILAGRVTNSNITISGNPRIQGSVFGGGEMASIGWWDTIRDPNDHKLRAIYKPNTGKATITIGKKKTNAYPYDDDPVIGTWEEFASSLEQHSEWTIFDTITGELLHTCTGNVFGGGQGEVDTLRPHWISMSRSRESLVTINGGHIMSKVFGGSEQGSVAGNTMVILNGGTVGHIMNEGTPDEFGFGGVFGAGYGADDLAESISTYPNDSTVMSEGRDLVDYDHIPGLMAGRVYGNAEVRILGDTLKGNVYGGAERAYLGMKDSNNTYGNATVYIGYADQLNPETGAVSNPDGNATFVGTASVFGANKFGGTPYGDVTVHIIQTAHVHTPKDNYYPEFPDPLVDTLAWLATLENDTANFAIFNVFGGGDQSDYAPRSTKEASVIVYLCDQNTIYQVYGGSNAASIGPSTPPTGSNTTGSSINTNVRIFGGRMHQVFGGGKGENGDPTADPPIPSISADIHGTANTTIFAGLIDELYGGGNQLGDIDHINLVVNADAGGCPEFISEVFGGSNEAPITGDVVTVVECCPGQPAYYDELYGGCHNAPIYGNVTLNVYGGHINNLFGGSKGGERPANIMRFPTSDEITNHPDDYPQYVKDYLVDHDNLYGLGGNVTTNLFGGTVINAFGGSNINGNIDSLIMVNVVDAELDCPLDVTNVYGASNTTPYTPKLISVSEGDQETTPESPIVNVVHIKQEFGIRGNVFGGAKGYLAKVTSNPVVNIGYDPTSMSKFIPTTLQGYIPPPESTHTSTIYNVNSYDRQALVSGNVYGAGSEAQLEGNTKVTVQTEGEVGRVKYRHKISTGNNDLVPLDSVYHAKYQDLVNNEYTEIDYGGKVFGGGKGIKRANTTSALYSDSALVMGNTNVFIKGGHVQYSVYGGGEMASVRHKMNGTNPVANTGKAVVTINGGQVGPAPAFIKKHLSSVDSIVVPIGLNGVDGYVFGGGQGEGDDVSSIYKSFANVDSTRVIVDMPMPTEQDSTSNRIWGSIFGGGEDGHVIGNAVVDFRNGLMGTDGTTSYDGNIFGGGRNYDHMNYTAGRVGGNIEVTMTGGVLFGSVFGGGRLGLTGINENGVMYDDNNHGNVTVNISGTSIVGNAKKVNTWTATSIGDVFGGGKGSTDTIFDNSGETPTIITLPEKLAKVKNAEVNVWGDAHVLASVYGGGELASVGWLDNEGETVAGRSVVNVTGGQVGMEPMAQVTGAEGNVFGGGYGKPGPNYSTFAHVDSTRVLISGDAYIVNSVYGGSESGHVHGNTNVTVSGGVVGRPLTYNERLIDSKNNHVDIFTGNVYGGGRGSRYIENTQTYSKTAGIVYGNTNVIINGGIIRHNVYGGGALASVGTYNYKFDETNQQYTDTISSVESGTGRATILITSKDGHYAHIGPTLEDLTEPSEEEFMTLFADSVTYTITNMERYADSAFKYLGGNEGSVYGSSRGMSGPAYDHLAYTDSTFVIVEGNAQVVSGVFGGGENGHVHGSTNVEINGGTIGAVPWHEGDDYEIPDGPYAGQKVSLRPEDSEIAESKYGTGRRIFRGSVFGGGRGTDTYLDHAYTPPVRFNPVAGRVFGNTKVKVTDGMIYGHVYGGGTIASVGTYKYDNQVTDSIKSTISGGVAVIEVSGGQIGTDGNNNGNVYGGGLGVAAAPKDQLTYLAYVDSTNVTIKGSAKVKNSVYGGSPSGHVQGNTKVTVTDNAEVGISGHGDWHSNVYGGGGGNDTIAGSSYLSISSGRVFGNTEVNIEGNAQVYHNVYGGGAIASVGVYDLSGPIPLYVKNGSTKVNIKSGTIGVDGNDNGMVFGSGRGLINPPGTFLDSLTYVAYTEVNIGKETNPAFTDVKVNGSVYGSGENGHVYKKAVVNVYSGTIGCTAGEFSNDPTWLAERFPYRGNVYGAGCGTDTYDKNDTLSYNPLSGIVQGETEVNIKGGYISRNVYGGGAMASVGYHTVQVRHTGDTLSWPYVLNFTEGMGKAVVNVTGGHIGTLDAPILTSGDVFGGSRGIATNRYRIAPFANVDTAYVNVNFEPPAINDINDETPNLIVGCVYGSGENGHVYDTTSVTIDNGLIKGSVFGGGKGTDTYWDSLAYPHTAGAPSYYHTNVRSITAGKVYGNTSVTINGGTVLHNVFGGGNLASVGKGNYNGYGEAGDYDVVRNSGHCHVTINNGTIGTNGFKDDEGVYNGYVYGSSRGTTYPNVTTPSGAPRYRYSRDFFLGYANQTFVTVGDRDKNHHVTIWGSVFGGGENGHVRDSANVIIDSTAVIGVVYQPAEGETINDSIWKFRGNVYGAGQGIDTIDGSHGLHCSSAGSVTRYTHVTVKGGTIYNNVYGGGSMGSVGPPHLPPTFPQYDDPSLTRVDILGGTIGDQTSVDQYKYGGNVFGGGRGKSDSDITTAVEKAYVNIGSSDNNVITTPTVYGSVYGGGDTSMVYQERVASVNKGTVYGDVFGGNNSLPESVAKLTGLKTVNVRGGLIKGNVFGSSNMATEGETPSTVYNAAWNAFVNITGGTIEKDVYAAGYAGRVDGSVCVNIGAKAVTDAPTKETVGSQEVSANRYMTASDNGSTVAPTPAQLVIGGSVYGGSKNGENSQYGWSDFDISQYAVVYIDGTGYDTKSETAPTQQTEDGPYMNISQGLFGSGTTCESGALGRQVLLRNYGHRVDKVAPSDTLITATRTFTTIQRCGHVLLDSANVNLSGAYDISGVDTLDNRWTGTRTKYGVMMVDTAMYMSNGSGIVLGEAHNPIFMDSIRMLMSVYLPEGTVYDSALLYTLKWDTVGIQGDTPADARLYRVHHNDNGTVTPVLLNTGQENTIIFNDTSKLYVRYWEKKQGDVVARQYYGELGGFFRMRADSCVPSNLSRTFAYARPKLAGYPGVEHNNSNMSDGGFLSYNTAYNYYSHGGSAYTNTKQYPYLHPYLGWRAQQDMTDYRVWNGLPEHDTVWYVDGTRGWGNDTKSKKEGSGLYPDKPKKTIFGAVSGENLGGIVSEVLSGSDRYLNFSYEKDIIYVVGALSAQDEGAYLCDSIKIVVREDDHIDTIHYPKYPLKLFRYPGGHVMSNGAYDNGAGGSEASTQNKWGTPNPGANYGAMLNVQPDKNIAMQGVVMDGLYGDPLSSADTLKHKILPVTAGISNYYNPASVTEPLIVTHSGSKLSLSDSTRLMRGYNSTNAAVWYTDAFYDTAYLNLHNNSEGYAQETGFRHGGAIYVDGSVDGEGHDIGATVNVRDTVIITGNKQYLQIGEEAARVIESNVFLPTFSKSLYITGSLHDSTRIGVTSPRANNSAIYHENTLSPVAVVPSSVTDGSDVADAAWQKCNFLDDQGWFFVNENSPTSKRTTFYGKRGANYETLYFGWTWANVVRKAPEGFDYDKIDSPEDLAWLISQSAGMNGETATNFSDEFISQTHDISLGQYVWVPIGDTVQGLPFAGYFDGRGHLIDSLYIDYIGEGDSIYERHNYGMFGYVENDTIDRTFLVGGKISPEILTADANSIGGLVGCLKGNEAVVSNSEAAVEISYADNSTNAANTTVNRGKIVAGGLVGKMESGEIHSSMAMPDMRVPDDYTGTMGGLVGISESGKINNSFTNAKFGIGEDHLAFEAGGLLGRNGLLIDEENITAAVVRNCYVTMRDTNEYNRSVDGLAATNLIKNNIGKCYAGEGLTINTANCDTDCGHFAPTMGADSLGYMYADNRVHLLSGTTDTTLFMVLNRWVYANNTTKDSTYAHWARPGLQEINGDLPVLLLSEYDYTLAHQGGFRSMGTYAGSHVLQYGGPDRDKVGAALHEVDSALTRPKASNKADYLFIYGDVVNRIGISKPITQSKVSIYEHASIKSAGDLAKFEDTYVGVTFDNSCRGAYSTQNVNYGLVGVGGYLLPRDWHMFSTPLSDAPLGFNYFVGGVNTNETAYNSGVYGNYYNNPWRSTVKEFDWIRTYGSDECANGDYRYWMFMPDDPNLPEGQKTDGYFPTRRGSLYDGHENELFITGTDECPEDDKYRYPYGMDFFTWYEPEYHWVNFKRNGPNHWHSDEPHDHLAYYGDDVNVNEDTLITGRGYMASISVPTFMQSHGKLNRNATESSQDVSIILTKQGANCTGWNLVGNPFHGYLDFNAFAAENGLDSYVVYDADGYEDSPESAFLCYPKQGSEHGAYAGRYLHPHQAFFVLASSDSITMNFNDAAMVAPRSDLGVGGEFDGHFRGDDLPSYPLVNLFLSSDKGCSDITVVEFERPEWGGAKKLRELRRGNGLFYGYHEEQGYAALFAKEGTTRVPLWFEAKEDDVYTIKWNTANGDFNSLYLIDNILGVQYDMLANNTYTFEGHKQDYKARFYIVFDVTGVEEEFEQNIFAFFDGSQWVVTGEGELDLVDMQGRILWHEKLRGGQSRLAFPTLAKSMYLLRLTNSSETKVQKIIVK